MRNFFKALWELCKPFWGTKQNWLAWLIFITVILIGSGITYLNVRINDWQKVFYDVLAELKTDQIVPLMMEYGIYIGIFVIINVYRTWLRKLLIIRWREAMTEQFIDKWLSKQIFYKLAHRKKMDNPDQRIAEDIRIFIEYSIELTVSLLFNVIQLFSFLMVLWRLSGKPEFTLFGETFVIEGYLVWVALIYAVVGTVLTHLIGRKLHGLNYQQQVYEANFRSSLIRKQDNAEQIALYKGEKTEKATLGREFAEIVRNWRMLMDKERNLGFFTVGYSRFSILLPTLLSIPLLIAKIVTIGGLMQIRTAFQVVLNSFSWFIYAYSSIPKWTSAVVRLNQLKQEIDALENAVKMEIAETDKAIDTEKLAIFTPENNRLLHDISLSIEQNKWIYLKGQSGLGKSTLLRVLSGIWDYYDGQYRLPNQKSLLIPQRSYLNRGTLADVLSYPDSGIYTEQQLNNVLEKVGLTRWVGYLDQNQNWASVFSGGEQQRIAFARILLSKPNLLYLDEVTSSLDMHSAGELMQLLKDELPESTVIFISHQQGIERFADIEVDLTQFKSTNQAA
ncbi:ABC transporter ATP-binding protein/permease [Bibersteinia trehalosi]|uniref:ABC transporter ATP-binding protein/permease n=1 Tax=Bibersteinia trehalosi TaxID=47735 RepID=A0A3R8LBX6_BIBTR|nr:ABC transporter ATP-binding protein/permease [Bibersteinia trehalosi]RRN00490.1 ABC transporter ATP-binding protein/permease [Bibersteinia trehalosi]